MLGFLKQPAVIKNTSVIKNPGVIEVASVCEVTVIKLGREIALHCGGGVGAGSDVLELTGVLEVGGVPENTGAFEAGGVCCVVDSIARMRARARARVTTGTETVTGTATGKWTRSIIPLSSRASLKLATVVKNPLIPEQVTSIGIARTLVEMGILEQSRIFEISRIREQDASQYVGVVVVVHEVASICGIGEQPVFAKVARAGLDLSRLAGIEARAGSVSIESRGLGAVGRLLWEVFLPLIMTSALLVM